MTIKQKLSEIAGAIRVKQGYAADDTVNHAIAFNDFASAIAGLGVGGVSVRIKVYPMLQISTFNTSVEVQEEV